MKKQLLILFVLLFSLTAYSQVTFEEGYFIDNSNQKVNCLIKNIDWKNNPTEIEYKLTENSEIQKATLETIKEFEVHNAFKYVRDTVMIDKSLNKPVSKLTTDSKVNFEEEVLFLKVLVAGKASLYSYEQGDLKKYFYNKDNSEIEQLIYKRFLAEQLNVATNKAYKQQLFNDLKCSTFSKSRVKRLEYSQKKLIKFFVEYNECNAEEFINYEERQERQIFNLNIRPGVNMSTLLVENHEWGLKDLNFDNEFSFRIGIEAEYILPFNKNKWAVIIEPTYHSYKSKTTNKQTNIPGDLLTAEVDYSSLEIPAGIRHYFYLNNNSKLFVNATFILDLTFNKSIELTRADDSHYYSMEIETRPNYALGVGYKLQDKYSLELRYQTKRDLLANYIIWNSKFNSLSLIIGYTLF